MNLPLLVTCMVVKEVAIDDKSMMSYDYLMIIGWMHLTMATGHRLKILWGKAQAGIPSAAQRAAELPPVPGLPRG